MGSHPSTMSMKRMEGDSIWRYRGLVYILTVSDLKVKYQSSMLGFTWSLLNPLLMMLVLYAVFSNVFSALNNFAQYLLVGIVTWRFFANGTSAAIYSIAGRPSLVTKIYVPRQVLVLSTVLSSFISSLLEIVVLLVILLTFGARPHQSSALIPAIHLIYLVLIYGVSLALSSLYVYYRDLNQIWEVLLQLGFFLAPVVYPLSVVPKRMIGYLMLNPITIVMEMYRGCLIYDKSPLPGDIILLASFASLSLLAGSIIFSRLERRFAEAL
jgi:lipopolysaccharide transport system permease protein